MYLNKNILFTISGNMTVFSAWIHKIAKFTFNVNLTS